MPATPFHADLLWPSSGVGVVEVAGEVDMHTALELGDVLQAAVGERPDRLILDISAVGFIDSMGLSALVRSARQLIDGGGAFEVVCSDARVLQIFEITGLRDVLTFHDNRAAALGG